MACRQLLLTLILGCLACPAVNAVSVVNTIAGRPTHAFSLAATRSPRLLTAGRELTVRVRLTNLGSRDWVPESQINFSYHWWTTSGAGVEFDGERTGLPHAVPSSGVVDLEARLRAPDRPGVYLLQWDMVEEGVTWFSERDVRPPSRTVVIVMPSLAALMLPLPTVVAVIGVLWLRRVRRLERHQTASLAFLFVVGAWCTLSLITKQLFLVVETGLEVDAPQVAMRAFAALAAPGVLAVVLTGRRLAWSLWAMTAAGAVVIAADVLYFRYFGDVISVPALLASGQAGYLGASIVSLLAPRDAWLIVDLAVAAVLVGGGPHAELSPLGRRMQRCVAGGCVAAAVGGGYAVLHASHEDQAASAQVFRNLSQVQALGVFTYHVWDGWRYLQAMFFKPPLDQQHLQDIEQWFSEHVHSRAGGGPAFAAARGRNLIVIQVESMQRFVIGLRMNGAEITPNLNRWREESLFFSNVTDQTSEGRTSDCEFLGLTSLLPVNHGAAAFRYPINHYTALPAVLKAHGYETLSAVAFDASFWNRRVTHATYGFAQSLFKPSFAPGLQVGWGLNDRDFLAQMVPRLLALRQPFAAWLITLSLHYPFDGFPDRLKRLDLGDWENRPFGNYLHAMSFVDAAIGQFLTKLDERGFLANTVVVILGDHDAGFPWDGAIARAIGFQPHVLDWYLQDAVPLFMHVPASSVLRGKRPTTAGQADITPTLLALLGIDPAPFAYVGRNLLGEPSGEPIVRPYGDWMDEHHLFVSGSAPGTRTTCYDLEVRDAVSPEECRAGSVLATRARTISREVLTYDLQERLSHSPSPDPERNQARP